MSDQGLLGFTLLVMVIIAFLCIFTLGLFAILTGWTRPGLQRYGRRATPKYRDAPPPQGMVVYVIEGSRQSVERALAGTQHRVIEGSPPFVTAEVSDLPKAVRRGR